MVLLIMLRVGPVNTCGPPCQPIRCGLARSVIGRLPETDPDASTITASPTSIPAEGDSTSRIIVQLKDATGNITPAPPWP
jgi:hypothetical protein